jgi:nucleotide-binding universal stress UspA family protein
MTATLPAREFGIKSILVGSDFSEVARKPLRRAISIARHFQAKLYVTHVVSSAGLTIAGPDALGLATEAAVRDVRAAERKLVADGNLAGVDHEFLVRQGDVWEELRAIILEKQVDAIVIGTHGRQGIDKLVLGSTAEQIFREAGNLVLTVGPHTGSDGPLEGGDGVHSILFPTDFGAASLRALPYAISFSNHFGAKLFLLHVAPVVPIPEGFSWSSAPDSIEQIREDARRKALKELLEFVSKGSALAVAPELMVEFGKHGEEILRAAHHLKSDLIVMGLDHAKHGRAVSHLPQTTAYKVATEANCSVLTVRN